MRSIIGIGLLGMSLLTGCVFLDGSFHEHGLESLNLDVTNPAILDKSRFETETPPSYMYGRGSIGPAQVELTVPNYIDARHASVMIVFRGASVAWDRAVSHGDPTPGWAHGSLAEVDVVDLTQDRQLMILGLDGERTHYNVHATFPTMKLTYARLKREANPQMRRPESVGYGDQQVDLPVPEYLNPDSLRIDFLHNAMSVDIQGQIVVPGVSEVNLTNDQMLTLWNASGLGRSVILHRVPIPADTAAGFRLHSLNIYTSLAASSSGTWVSAGPMILSTDDPPYQVGVVEKADEYHWVLRWKPDPTIDPSHLYVEFGTHVSGWGDVKVTSQGKPLQGYGALMNGFYGPNNWVDLTKPVELVFTTEDLSTVTYTLIPGLPL